ncbi:VPLPA-CTERM sorting domain-containing protein [Paracoccus fontiphilus]|uniref:VPLPA-CTERM sorting domain-containing protein n=1 Tax=Paracoccus fontiphilus TaxID=1815556 RepID=A0ABV7IE56_9RHOB|nr:VPLPA-CTERM sorting domain-containing protein [Paracoccus fontiphilus]
MRVICLAMAAAMLSAGAVGAATLKEGFGADEFSGDWKKPTMIAAGVDGISGSWGSHNDYDILGFRLKGGAQTVTLTFSPKAPIGDRDWSFSAGGEIHYQTFAPRYGIWEGMKIGKVDMTHATRGNDFTYTLSLDEKFDGLLYLSLYGTHGSLNYNISVPGNALSEAQPAPVPLPAGAALLPAGLAAMALLRRRRKR